MIYVGNAHTSLSAAGLFLFSFFLLYAAARIGEQLKGREESSETIATPIELACGIARFAIKTDIFSTCCCCCTRFQHHRMRN